MPINLTANLVTPNPYIPIMGYAETVKIIGGQYHFKTVADLAAAITAQRQTITDGLDAVGGWIDNAVIRVTGEFYERRFLKVTSGSASANAAATHARTMIIHGYTYILDGDNNTVLATIGAPATGNGSVGDLAVDLAARLIYKKVNSNTWSILDKLGQRVAVAVELTAGGISLPLSAMQVVTPVNLIATAAFTLPLASLAWAFQPFGFIELFIRGIGLPTFNVQGGQTPLRDGGSTPGAQYKSVAARVISSTEWAWQ